MTNKPRRFVCLVVMHGSQLTLILIANPGHIRVKCDTTANKRHDTYSIRALLTYYNRKMLWALIDLLIHSVDQGNMHLCSREYHGYSAAAVKYSPLEGLNGLGVDPRWH